MGQVFNLASGKHADVRKMICPICEKQSFERIRVDLEGAQLHWYMLRCSNCRVLLNEQRVTVAETSTSVSQRQY